MIDSPNKCPTSRNSVKTQEVCKTEMFPKPLVFAALMDWWRVWASVKWPYVIKLLNEIGPSAELSCMWRP